MADDGYVLEKGRIVLEGPARELARNPRIAQGYMGVLSSDSSTSGAVAH